MTNVPSTKTAVAETDNGPASYRNWRAHLAGKPVYGRSEIPIYSDVQFTVEKTEGLGPYRFQHAFPADLTDPALVLHVDGHLNPRELPAMDKTETSGFTGASLGDEIAALLSLLLGRRFMGGDPTRFISDMATSEWVIMGDRNQPTFFRSRPLRLFGSNTFLLPQLAEPICVSALPLATLSRLSPEAATALVRAARLYRDAIWIVEREPEMTWLLLVSALEVAAVQQHVETPLIEILKQSKPKIVERLDAIDPALAEQLAQELSRELRATARFLGFMSKFMPEPPELRPPEEAEWARLDWSPKAMKKALEGVYKLRSLALHEGIPFPPPMCDPPLRSSSEWPAASERVMGLATAMVGGVWKSDELPMCLHMFEHIARGALINWWQALASAASPSNQPE